MKWKLVFDFDDISVTPNDGLYNYMKNNEKVSWYVFKLSTIYTKSERPRLFSG
jgi:hypothetical protein